MTELNIVPECEVDTRLVQILANFRKPPNHAKGHGKVANKLKSNLKNRIALGVIDEDKIKIRKSPYFELFTLTISKHNLTLKKHPSLTHYLILIKPAIEMWLLENAKASGVSSKNLGDNLEDLTNFTKKKDIHKNIHFTTFIKELIAKQAPGIITLKTWLEDFLTGRKLS